VARVGENFHTDFLLKSLLKMLHVMESHEAAEQRPIVAHSGFSTANSSSPGWGDRNFYPLFSAAPAGA
jgi:hypothetical protein